MNVFTRMLVSLSLAILLASACGGREEDAAAPKAPRTAGNAVPDADKPLAHLSPKEIDALARYVDSYVATTGDNRKAVPKTPAANAASRKVNDVTRVESSDGSTIDLPDTFASDLPIFPGAEPTRHVSGPTLGSLTEFETDQTVDEARRFYSDQLGKSGWMLISDLNEAGLSLIVAEKDGRDLSVAITEEGGRTKITTMENEIP